MLAMNHWNYTLDELERMAFLNPDDPQIAAALAAAECSYDGEDFCIAIIPGTELSL